METAVKLAIAAHADREIVIMRTFDAPPRLVFDAWTKPELLKRWLTGPSGWTMVVCEVDLQIGGSYRFIWRQDVDGTEIGNHGVYREIVPAERLVCTELFDDPWYPGESLISTTLAKQDGKTVYTCTLRYESRQARDLVLDSPMEGGVAQSYNRLDELLATLRADSGATDGA
ncbi:SRPBCC family protein [Crenobacter sp. SG2303]|uniref:SRPBCC family protein n=1 Tax=Crenobacter oryzisoli TaxID=3056844 RepID=A0ABT7XU47_9NEIS|nr:SRPBCC family protein [Crenobacter sp. SG2303]MDN0077309.1 SRPBCC family protein [Crenobacter sp. SG2303]